MQFIFLGGLNKITEKLKLCDNSPQVAIPWQENCYTIEGEDVDVIPSTTDQTKNKT